MAEDKGIVYNNRVLLGNWYEAATLEEYKLKKFLEQMGKGEIILSKYRKMSENLRRPAVLTQSTKDVRFGARVSLLAPHVPASDSPVEDGRGLLLGGRISADEINCLQDLGDGCSVVCMAEKLPVEMNSFIVTSSDFCERAGDPLKYNQEFLLALSSSVARNKPLYLRHDPNAVPGLCGKSPLYLSQHPVSNTRWRVLPVQTPELTRFEMEGQPVPVNMDVIINHCATNVNLGINIGCWTMGFYGKVCCPLMKTCLNGYGREMPNNIWQIHIPVPSGEQTEQNVL